MGGNGDTARATPSVPCLSLLEHAWPAAQFRAGTTDARRVCIEQRRRDGGSRALATIAVCSGCCAAVAVCRYGLCIAQTVSAAALILPAVLWCDCCDWFHESGEEAWGCSSGGGRTGPWGGFIADLCCCRLLHSCPAAPGTSCNQRVHPPGSVHSTACYKWHASLHKNDKHQQQEEDCVTRKTTVQRRQRSQ